MAQPRLTNNAGINLAVAVWLAHDDYDYNNDPSYISVTTIIKPVRQIVLGMRLTPEERVVDIADLIQNRFGQTLHTGIEHAWKFHYAESLAKLGTPKRAIERIRINPTEPADGEHIDVHTEVRNEILVAGYRVGGKFDLCIEGRLQDVKKTSVWGYMMQKGIGDKKWVLQGSIYRLINPNIVTHDDMFIQYLLMDWSRGMGKREPNYPPHALPHRVVSLMSPSETKLWLTKKLQELDFYKDQPEPALPRCSDEDLWRSEPTYKYFAKADAPAGTRSTKNFEELSAALMHKNEKGKGRIDVVPGKVKACNYCACAPICSQYAFLKGAGEIDE